MHRAAEVAERSLYADGYGKALEELEAQVDALKERGVGARVSDWQEAIEAVITVGRDRIENEADAEPVTQALQLVLEAYEKQAEELEVVKRLRSDYADCIKAQQASVTEAAKAAGVHVDGGGFGIQIAALTEAARKGAQSNNIVNRVTIDPPANGAVAIFDLKALLKANGWTVPSSSDATTYKYAVDPSTFETAIGQALKAAAFTNLRVGEVELLKKQVTELQKRCSELATENRGLRRTIEEEANGFPHTSNPFANVCHFMAINRFEIGREPHVPAQDRPDGIRTRLRFIFDEVIELIESCLDVSIDDEWTEAKKMIRDGLQLYRLQVRLPELAAEATDVAYSAFGLLLAVGYEPTKVWRVVHAANMQKIPDGIRPKKPEGWEPPHETIAGWSK